ncbi:Integrator complex subunit 2 [Sparganum proliferum]
MLSCAPVLAAYRAAANIDLDGIEESAITDIIPLLYFTVADIELLVIDRVSDYYLLKKSTEQIQLLDSFYSINFELLWKEGFAEYKKRCCSILESPTLIYEVLPCLVTLIIALPQPSLLPDIICGLSAHCSHAARDLVRLLILNFPHLWPAVWKRLLEVIVSADQQNLPTVVASNEGLAASGARSPLLRDCRASRALATLRYVITFMPQTECILDHCVSLPHSPSENS